MHIELILHPIVLSLTPHLIIRDPDNEKDLTVNPPGGAYGQAAPVQGKYEENGELKSVELVVTLG